MEPRSILRIEGLAALFAATAVYYATEAPWWLFVLLALAPDLSMVGYLAGPRAGSRLYNAAHTYVAPLALGALGVGVGVPVLWWAALVWTAHIGLDRAVGYGLKYPAGFKHTHLSGSGDRRTDAADLGDVGADPTEAR